MRINKLSDKVFYDFASAVIGINVELYRGVLQMSKTDKGVKLKLNLGGEKEDERKFLFQDTRCVYVNNAQGEPKKDISYNWIMYLLQYVDELEERDKVAIVDEYNNNLEKEINNYASQKREQLISL
jgi:exonuclease III